MEINLEEANLETVRDIIAEGMFDSGMEFYTIYATGDICRDMLQFNRPPEKGKAGTNRNESKTRTDTYRGDMLNADWLLSPQPVIFAINPKTGKVELIDGQHRLIAVVKASQTDPEITVPLTICVNAPHPSMRVVDRGGNRSAANDLAMGGYANPVILNAAFRLLYAYDHVPFDTLSLWRKFRISSVQLPTAMEQYEALPSAITAVQSAPSQVSTAVAAAVYFLISREHSAFTANEFHLGMAKGEHMGADDARLVMRNFLANQASQATRYRWAANELFGMLVVTANSWLRNDDTFRPKQVRDNLNRLPATGRKPFFPRLITAAELAQIQDTLV